LPGEGTAGGQFADRATLGGEGIEEKTGGGGFIERKRAGCRAGAASVGDSGLITEDGEQGEMGPPGLAAPGSGVVSGVAILDFVCVTCRL
jgi:hypothetical protein